MVVTSILWVIGCIWSMGHGLTWFIAYSIGTYFLFKGARYE